MRGILGKQLGHPVRDTLSRQRAAESGRIVDNRSCHLVHALHEPGPTAGVAQLFDKQISAQHTMVESLRPRLSFEVNYLTP